MDGRARNVIVDLSMLFFGGFFARSGSIKRVLTQLTLPQRSCFGQPEGPEVAPPSVFNGRNCIEVCSVRSGISSAASRYYCKGHFCDQFFTKFDETEYVYHGCRSWGVMGMHPPYDRRGDGLYNHPPPLQRRWAHEINTPQYSNHHSRIGCIIHRWWNNIVK